MKNILDNKVVLVTGGTGSFGNKFVEMILARSKLKKLIIFSRDEFKQNEMSRLFPRVKYPAMRYFLGDIRDKARLYRAFEGVDYVIHSAALKQVSALEYNPTEAINTNIMGANNIVDAAIDRGVKKVIALSTDKAVSPINLYGATKLVAEKIFIAANSYAGGKVKFAVVRYGNVIGSRGSVVPYFISLKHRGIKEFPVTDKRMTRFWITLEQGVDIVMKALELSEGGEVFVPHIPSMKITDLAKAIEPRCILNPVGIRPGEKIHEILVSEDEARSTKKIEGLYVILPQFVYEARLVKKYEKYPFVPPDFVYRSDRSNFELSIKDLQRILKRL